MSPRAQMALLMPIAGMLGLAFLLVSGAIVIDGGIALFDHPERWFSGLQGAAALDRIANAAEVVAGLLAIAITVVAIVVELAANRYTHRITELFVRERTNQVVLSFFVLTTIVCLWVSASPLDQIANARVAATLAMLMVTVCLLLLLPYLWFLFRFLAPRSIIARIAAQALDAARAGLRSQMLESIEELEDMARGARQHRDRGIALASTDALADVLRGYRPLRDALPPSWFKIDGDLARDPDFVALAPSAVADFEAKRIWLETKILRQYLSLFEEGFGGERDLGNLIALNTRALAIEYASDDPELTDLAVRFFNSFLRVAIRAGDLRTAYYVCDQYRGIAEDAIARGDRSRLHRIVVHLHEYGNFAYELGMTFLLEVVAWDIALLIEGAAETLPEEVDALLDRFLQVDREGESGDHEERLRGVRRTQVQLATFFLAAGDEVRARRIAEDMRNEDRSRLQAIHEALQTESREQYWEATDRGINFSYLSPRRRDQLSRFFELLEMT